MFRDYRYYDEEYVKKERSTHEIAAEHHTYPNKIRRELKGLGFELRDRSKAQSAALKHGRHCHPTKGRHLEDEVKKKISQALVHRKGCNNAENSEVEAG